jgi:hypothetical protein
LRDWVIARDAHLCGERDGSAFVEFLAEPSDRLSTYSSLLSAADCAAIDTAAYEDARTWFLNGQNDPTSLGGVSLGRAFELPATVMLIKQRRALLVLRKLLEDVAAPIRLRGVGDEWRSAARTLGATIIEDVATGDSPSMPGLRVAEPSRLERSLAALVGLGRRSKATAVFVDTPRWSRPYCRALLQRRSVGLVNPGARVLLDALLSRRSADCAWLAQEAQGWDGRRADFDVDPGDPWCSMRSSFSLLRPALTAWAEAGLRAGGHGVVAVATQDVTPPARAFLLGLEAGGGRVLTLEHGISGAYRGQVHSVADVLGTWGEPQAAYHREFGPPGLETEAIGWPRLEAAYATRDVEAIAAWDLVFFSQPAASLSSADWPEDNLTALRAVESYAAAHPERRVAVKLHPATAAYGSAAPELAHATLVTGDSLRLIRSARLSAVSFSTTGIESMASGRPVIQLARKGVLGPTEFISASGAAVLAEGPQELEAAAESLLADSSAYGRARERGLAYAREFIRGVDCPGGAVLRFDAILDGLAAV